jgi:hypothetical protein
LASGTTAATRLSGNWFISQVNGSDTAQTLRMTYTDWYGKEQHAWLLGNPTNGYRFLSYSAPADPSTAVDPNTCVASGICSYRSSINYVGSDVPKVPTVRRPQLAVTAAHENTPRN